MKSPLVLFKDAPEWSIARLRLHQARKASAPSASLMNILIRLCPFFLALIPIRRRRLKGQRRRS